jgi:uncharacterized BrkB/YihY/UPF0761 family membrane protein
VFAYFRAALPWTELIRRTVVDTFEDGVPGPAAQLAFYFLLALFPALLFVVSLRSGLTKCCHDRRDYPPAAGLTVS